MTFEDYLQSVESADAPEANLALPLQALWWDARGDWHRAHELCQQAGGREGDWVHAYLHRKEGDEGNASYWYSRAGREKPADSLEEEWRRIVEAFLTS